jgi:hypothetical protein
MRQNLVMGVCALLLAANLASPVAAKEQILTPEANGQITFVMPSNNVDCIYTPTGGTPTYTPENGGPELSCDRAEPSYVNVRLTPDAPALKTPDPGEQPCCSGSNTFAYGNAAHLGDDFLCRSKTTGLVCETAGKQHGFTISRAKILIH